jgi:hypothetical protein
MSHQVPIQSIDLVREKMGRNHGEIPWEKSLLVTSRWDIGMGKTWGNSWENDSFDWFTGKFTGNHHISW